TNTNTPLFAIKPTPHADLGLIATAPIPRGTRILTEPALLSLRPSATSPHAIHAAFLALPPTAQATILALDAVEDADSWPLRARIAELAKRREEQDSAALEREFVAALERFKVVNAGADGEPYVGVFPTASRLNHSCLPNTYITFNRGLGQLAVHATCDILPGEELTCTYLGAVSFYMSREWRQDGLRRWGF
ncbi:SET domain-containing protein, partial [Glonium stellatum]